jgi:hypothetical protein
LADVSDESSNDLLSFRTVRDFWVELDAEDGFRLVSDSGKGGA